MTPTISWPGTRGYSMPGKAPSLVNISLWQTPQAWILMRTVPGVGSGMSRSTTSKGAPGRGTWTASILGMGPSWVMLHARGRRLSRADSLPFQIVPDRGRRDQIEGQGKVGGGHEGF